MTWDSKNIIRAFNVPVPQMYNPTTDQYEVLQGRNGAHRVELYGPDGNPLFSAAQPGSVKLTDGVDALDILSPTADGIGSGNGVISHGFNLGYNGTSWDRWRNNTEGTLLASAERTEITSSAKQTNYNARGVILTLNITANPGNGETLLLMYKPIDPMSGLGDMHSLEIIAFATNSIFRLYVYPDATATPDTNSDYVRFRSAPVPRSWEISVLPSGTGVWTYSLGYQYIV